jgi:hypothetical protein
MEVNLGHLKQQRIRMESVEMGYITGKGCTRLDHIMNEDIRQELTIPAGFYVLSAVVMMCTIFWDITPCSSLSVN